jgi:hypothetical protein
VPVVSALSDFLARGRQAVRVLRGLPATVPTADVVVRRQATPVVPDDLQATADGLLEQIKADMLGGRLTLLPYLDNGTAESPAIRAEYPKMLREAVVKSGLLTNVLSVASSELRVLPDDKSDPRQVEAAEFVRDCLRRLPDGEAGLVWNLLVGPLVHGWGVCERLWRPAVEATGKWAGKRMWADFKAKDPAHLALDLDPYRNVLAVRSLLDTAAVVDPRDVVIVSVFSLYENPFGMSHLRAAYFPYWRKDTAWKFRMYFLEKFKRPFLKATYPSKDVKASLEAALARAGKDGWVALPPGVLLDVVDLSVSGTADFESAIADCNREMLIALKNGYLQTLEGQVSDGRGNTQIHQQEGDLLPWYLGTLVAQRLNAGPVPELIRENYTDLPPSRVVCGSVSDAELQASIAVDTGLYAMDFPLDLEERAEFYGRKIGTEPGKILRKSLAAAPAGGAPGVDGSGGTGGEPTGGTGPTGPGGEQRDPFAEAGATP